MVSISDVKASNARITLDSVPRVSVLSGATDGIGKAFLTRLVATKLEIRVYVLGRNGGKHKPFLDELRRSNAKADVIWIECQLSQGADIRKACDEVKRRETSIDLLYMSAGFIQTGDAKSSESKEEDAQKRMLHEEIC